jgi:hypothetical protein
MCFLLSQISNGMVTNNLRSVILNKIKIEAGKQTIFITMKRFKQTTGSLSTIKLKKSSQLTQRINKSDLIFEQTTAHVNPKISYIPLGHNEREN